MENEKETEMEETKQNEVMKEERQEQEYTMISLKPPTKERLYKEKKMNESWDDLVNRVLDKVGTNDGI